MGAPLPGGRYMDDSGKVHRSYSDALAETRTKRDRVQQEQLLRQSRMYYQASNDQAAQAQFNKGWMGWIPGVGQQLDRVIERSLNDKAAAADAIRAREGQLAVYRAAMGEGTPPPTVDRSLGALPTPPAPGLAAPAPQVTPAARARQEAVTTMAQQYGPQDYWKSQTGAALAEAAKSGPKAGDAGYAQRADIQAWIEANKDAPKGADGKNIVDRFLEKQRAQGLLDAPGSGGAFVDGGVRMPVDAESAAQAGRRDMVGFDGTLLEQAQADVARLRAPEREAWNKRVFSGQVSSPELDQYMASIGVSGADVGAYADAFTMKPSEVAYNSAFNLAPWQGTQAQPAGELAVAQPPARPEINQPNNLAPATETAQQQKADDLVKNYTMRIQMAPRVAGYAGY